MSDLALKNNDKIGIMCLDEDGYCFFSPKK
jgi:hypothetical protein